MDEILIEIRKLQAMVEAGFGSLGQRMDSLEQRMDSLEKRMDSLEKRMDSLEKRVDSLEKHVFSNDRRITTLAEQVTNLGRLLDTLIDEQRRLGRAQSEMELRLSSRIEALNDRLSEMLKVTTQARTEDVARFLAFEERLLALELKN